VLLLISYTEIQAQAITQAAPTLVTTSPELTFDKIMENLFTNDCVILTANQQLGLITFRTQSEEYPNSARRRVNVLEGTILFKPDSPASTRTRVKLSLSWQESNDLANTFRTGASKEADAKWYKMIFDMLGVPVPSSNT
jgi:hypothetical protein